jgi:hypothetical protein
MHHRDSMRENIDHCIPPPLAGQLRLDWQI